MLTGDIIIKLGEEEINIKDILNAIIDFVMKILSFEFPELDEIL